MAHTFTTTIYFKNKHGQEPVNMGKMELALGFMSMLYN
jgi:hypothetical protein